MVYSELFNFNLSTLKKTIYVAKCKFSGYTVFVNTLCIFKNYELSISTAHADEFPNKEIDIVTYICTSKSSVGLVGIDWNTLSARL